MCILKDLEDYDETSYKNEININLINEFIKNYSDIELKDNKKPIFSLTKKYTAYKIKNKEYNKKKNVWKKLENTDEDNKIKTEIKFNLNKISDEEDESIIIELKKCLIKSTNIDILYYFIELLYDKIIYDKKFQSKYLELLDDINKYNKIYNNYTVIKSKNNKYYWFLKNSKENNKKKSELFNSKKNAFYNIKENISLYKLLLNKINKEYHKRYEYITNMENEEDDELRYKLKRKYIGVFEILAILYNNKNINSDLLKSILNTLLKFNNINYDIECLNILLKIININLIDKTRFIEKPVLENFIKIFESIDKSLLKNRIKFLSYDILDKFNEYLDLV